MSESARKWDAIFVLAGALSRKVHGLELYRQGAAPRLVVSVARFEIRGLGELSLPAPLDLLSVAQAVPPAERHFFVEFDVSGVRQSRTRRGRFGTLSEIEALADWCEGNTDVRELAILSTAYHLPRVAACCKALLPPRVRCEFVAAPGEKPSAGLLTAEIVKRVGYRAMLMLGAGKRSGR